MQSIFYTKNDLGLGNLSIAVNLPRGQNKRTIEKFCASVFPGTEPASYSVKWKKGSDNARLLFRSKSECQPFVEACTGPDRGMSARQGIFLAHYWKAANQLITSHFQRRVSLRHASSTERMPECASQTGCLGSPCRFSKWSWHMVCCPKCMKRQSFPSKRGCFVLFSGARHLTCERVWLVLLFLGRCLSSLVPAWPDNPVNLLSRLSRVDDQCFETCALSYPEFPTAL